MCNLLMKYIVVHKLRMETHTSTKIREAAYLQNRCVLPVEQTLIFHILLSYPDHLNSTTNN